MNKAPLNLFSTVEYQPQTIKDQLLKLIEEYVVIANDSGIKIKPFSSKALSDFDQYPEQIQLTILENFKKSFSAVTEINNSQIHLKDTQKSLWRIFRKFNLKPTSDLFTVIDQNDVVEVYLKDNVQWYRSFNYFDYTSYSLSDLICYPWTELVEHENDHTAHFMEIAQGIFKNEIKETQFLKLGPSISHEKFSEKRFTARAEAKAISPIMNQDGTNEGLIVVWSIEILNQTQPQLTQAKNQEFIPEPVIQL